ncbi:MAG: hypothetical protein ACE5PT_02605 [Gemmatimonadales bacterium]
MPVASALAAVAGILLMFWRRTMAVFRASRRFVQRTVGRLFADR